MVQCYNAQNSLYWCCWRRAARISLEEEEEGDEMEVGEEKER